jgi:hypothetical protein
MIDLPEDVKAFFQKAGSKGGKTAAKKMTAEARTKRAKKAVAAREAKRTKKPK